MTERERGQVLPLVALLLAGMGAAMFAIGLLGGAAVERGQARTAADAAALAGAVGGRADALALAAANGARLVAFEQRGDQAWVRVELGRATASARARRSSSSAARCQVGAGAAGGGGAGKAGSGNDGGTAGAGAASGGRAGGGSSDGLGAAAGSGLGASGGGAGLCSAGAGGLVPELVGALAQAGELLGRPVPVTSGYRSPAEQAALWARRHVNPYPVAAPGTSQHERGRAVDVPRAFVPLLLAVAGRVGLCHPYPESDPVHFELCR